MEQRDTPIPLDSAPGSAFTAVSSNPSAYSWEPPPFSLDAMPEYPGRSPSPPAMSSADFTALLNNPRMEFGDVPELDNLEFVNSEQGGKHPADPTQTTEDRELSNFKIFEPSSAYSSSAASTCFDNNSESVQHDAECGRSVRTVDTSVRQSPGGVLKPKAKRVSKAEEERLIARGLLVDLKGTTAARSRKMTEDERNIMLHKRRLRNRASAARSREKQRNTVAVLVKQVEELSKSASKLQHDCSNAQIEIQRLRQQNAALLAAFASRTAYQFSL